MILNSRGIVLSSLRYSDSSVIARIYTEKCGLRSFMVRTGKGKAAMSRRTLLQPLTLVEVAFTDDERKTLHTARSLEREHLLQHIPFDTHKTCVALFLAEVIFRSIGEEEPNPKLFGFLHLSVLRLDNLIGSVANFHLQFMLDFSRWLGFYPQRPLEGATHFDMMEGEFAHAAPLHGHVLEGVVLDAFIRMMQCTAEEAGTLRLDRDVRKKLLQRLIDLYRLHLQGMKEITSHKVLEEVLG